MAAREFCVAQGYHVIVALDEEDALERVEGGRAVYSLLLVNVVGVHGNLNTPNLGVPFS